MTTPDKNGPTVTELVVEGFSEGGFRAEHALACALADAAPTLKLACSDAVTFLTKVPPSPERDALIERLNGAIDLASTPASKNAH